MSEKTQKFILLTVGVFAMSLVIGYLVLAWSEPSQNPPQGNVPAPLNVGPQGQAKAGGLILNTGGAPTGLIVRYGNVGIGTTAPSTKLHVVGWTRVGGVYAGDTIQFETQNGFHRIAFNNLRFWDWDTGGDMVTFNNGNVGIGTTAPAYKLDIAGDVRWTGTLQGGSVPWARLTSFPGDCPSGQYVYGIGSTLKCSAPPSGGIGGSGTTNYLAKFTGSTTIGNSTIYDNGNVGIGTTAPESLLHIKSSGSGTVTIQGTSALLDLVSTESGKRWRIASTGLGTLNFFKVGEASNLLVLYGNGVGIGTTNPGNYRLYVNGDQKITGSLQVARLEVTDWIKLPFGGWRYRDITYYDRPRYYGYWGDSCTAEEEGKIKTIRFFGGSDAKTYTALCWCGYRGDVGGFRWNCIALRE